MSSIYDIDNAHFMKEMRYSLGNVTQMGNHMDWLELLINMEPSLRGTVSMEKSMDLEDGSDMMVTHKLDGGVMIDSKVMVINLIQMDLLIKQVGFKLV